MMENKKLVLQRQVLNIILKLEEKVMQSWVGDELDKFKHSVRVFWYMQNEITCYVPNLESLRGKFSLLFSSP